MKRPGSLSVTASGTLLLIGSYLGCEPNLDELSADYGRGGAPQGGASSGGTDGGSADSGGTLSSGGLEGGGQGGKPVTGNGGRSSGGAPNVLKGGAPNLSGGFAGESGAGAGAGGVLIGGAGGEAGAPCTEGRVTCPGGEECGTDLTTGNPAGTTVDNCGACGVTCSTTNVTSAVCSASRCQNICEPTFADCNAATANDGCETDVTTVLNCGACGHACSAAATSAVACHSGLCAPTCAPKFGDCNADTGAAADDGCETYLDSLNRCGTSCAQTATCMPNEVCSSGVCGPPQGVIQMKVPLAATSDDQRFADKFTQVPSLLGASITLRLHAPGATGGQINIYLSDNDFTVSSGIQVSLADLASGWKDVTLVVGGSVGGSFDPSEVKQVNIEVTGGNSGPWATPTILYLDSVRTSNQAIMHTFDSSVGDFVQSSLQNVPGSTYTWLNALP